MDPMPKLNLRGLLVALLLLILANPGTGEPRSAAGAATDDTLVVFLGPEDAFATRDLRGRLDAYRSLAQELGVTLDVRSLDEGAPSEVVITPLILFQNARGRSVYQGRYDNLEGVRNFLSTARVIPQSQEPLTREDVPVWNSGRARVATPIKLTALSGKVPAGLDASRFHAESVAALAAGMQRFELQPSV
jgi:hypothetical protein